MRTLLLTNTAPWPTVSGAAQRTRLLFQSLSQLGLVDLALIGKSGVIDENTYSTLKMEWRLLAYLSATEVTANGIKNRRFRLPSFLDQILGADRDFRVDDRLHEELRKILQLQNYDLLVARYCESAFVCGIDLLKSPCPRIVDVDDVPWSLWRTREQTAKSLRERLVSWAAGRILKKRLWKRLPRIDHFWVPKPSDRGFFDARKTSVLSNAVISLPTGSLQPPSVQPTILFVGLLNHGPNREGIEWFLEKIFPLILEEMPSVKFHVAGLGHEGVRVPQVLPADSVVFRGYVQELSSEYALASLCIAPIRNGAGTKIKVLEALANARSCVATVHSAEGFEDIADGSFGLVVARDEPEFARHCLEILRAPEKAFFNAERGRGLVAERYGPEAFMEAVANDVETLFTAKMGVTRPCA